MDRTTQNIMDSSRSFLSHQQAWQWISLSFIFITIITFACDAPTNDMSQLNDPVDLDIGKNHYKTSRKLILKSLNQQSNNEDSTIQYFESIMKSCLGDHCSSFSSASATGDDLPGT